MKALWPVFEMRPTETFFRGEFYRYADGLWLPDDGEWDLAFIGSAGFPACLYVSLPYQKNILWSWLTNHWSEKTSSHPSGNSWHYSLRDGQTEWGGSWGQHNHPNTRAGDSGMHEMSNRERCSNGVHAEWVLGNKFIQSGLVRNKETKEIVMMPQKPVCMYCGLDWLNKAREKKK